MAEISLQKVSNKAAHLSRHFIHIGGSTSVGEGFDGVEEARRWGAIMKSGDANLKSSFA